MRANPAARLAQHYVDNFRVLPWRVAPGADRRPDPYRVWLSEVMLQQTSVAAVTPRFERFVARWPTIDALAAASDADILSEWAGLGYYARARNLIACARAVVAAGGFPGDSAGLRQLPGIGPYTAAAIAAIAFREQAPAIDTNIRRVLSRVHGLAEPTSAQLEALLLAWLPQHHPGDMVQALIDLGATICTPRRPRCAACPLAGDCAALTSGDPEAFPARKAKAARPQRFGTAWWIERGNALWLVRRPPRGLLGGMASLPGPEWTDAPDRALRPLATVRHVFTHFALDLAIAERRDPVGDGWWQQLDTLSGAGLPTLYRRAVEAVRERLEEAQGAP